MRPTFVLVAALLAVPASPALVAEPQPDDGARPPKPAVDLALDTDGDEVISAAEIAKAPASLKKLDLDGDGRLTREELRPKKREGAAAAGPGKGGEPPGPPDGQGRTKRPMPPVLAALDADGDGVVSPAELSAAPARLKKLDANASGRLEPDEYRPARPDEGYAGSEVKPRPRSAP